MNPGKGVNYFVDMIILILTVLISWSGLSLQIAFHMHRNDPAFIYMHFNKMEWLLIHKGLSVAITIGIIIHIAMHSAWLKNAFKDMAFLKSGYKNKSLFYLFASFSISAALGFISWLFTGILSVGDPGFRHGLMEFHEKVSYIFVILFVVHFIKKIKWLFNTTTEMIFVKK
ncbi:MAG TPA: hypothetical protein PKK26_17950 [Candidatus Wallbacteria bacterium]|nr:hypothetical protein [Candidatus Wallbacteria bacterium]